MNNNKCHSYEMEGRDRIYGEIYEYEGAYWAEVILIEDKLDWVTGQSQEFTSREQAVEWLRSRSLACPEPLPDRLARYFEVVAQHKGWTKLKAVARSFRRRESAA